jgi:RNA polymerase sigma-70 factor (ECF subfamily)
MTNFELADKIRKGDHSAMEWLFNEYYVGLCVFAKKFTKDKTSAEEIVQHTFFKLWEKRESLIINESVGAYLYRSVQNNCLNHLKHLQIVNKFNQYYTQKLQEAEEFSLITQETGQSIVIAKELEEKLMAAIDNLPGQCKEIFKMSRFECLKHQEIAEAKGVTVNTVQKQISIALEKIRIALGAYLSIFIAFVFDLQ